MGHDIKAVKKKWATRIAKDLVGATITGVSYISEEECDKWGWHSSSAILHMVSKDGTAFEVFPMRDDEGNDGGALGTTLETIPTIPVI